MGGWGGESGPKSTVDLGQQTQPAWQSNYQTAENLAALYRLTGDLHPIHIAPEIAKQNGFDRPILHGLCTLGIVARELAACGGHHAADLKTISARLSAPVMPGDEIAVQATKSNGEASFEAYVGDRSVLKSGTATFRE